MISLLWGFLGGVIAWVVTSLISQPLTNFLALRHEAATALARYERLDDFDPEEECPQDSVVCAETIFT